MKIDMIAAVIADQLLADSVEVVLTAAEARALLALILPNINLDALSEAVTLIDLQLASATRETVRVDRDQAHVLSEAAHLLIGGRL